MGDDPNRARQKHHEFESELAGDIAQARARHERAVRDGDRLADVQERIANLKRRGGDDVTVQLARLGRDHYDIAGADGGALGTRPSTADLARARRAVASDDERER